MTIQPINLLFRFLQSESSVVVRVQGSPDTLFVGKLIGFDEFMNLVFDDAIEIGFPNTKFKIGQILIKGDCIVTISEFKNS